MRAGLLAGLVLAAALSPMAARAEATEVTLWHSYRASEEAALEDLVRVFNETHPAFRVRVLPIPYDAFASKLTAAIPRGNGPDVFIYAHERIGTWATRGVLEPVGDAPPGAPLTGFLPETLDALRYDDALWGLPLAYKSTALFYNKALVSRPPQTTDALLEEARKLSDPGDGRYGLAWATDEFYFHAPWLHGFGGEIFDAQGRPKLDTAPIARSMAFVADLVNVRRIVPQEPTPALVTRLFNEGDAAMVINGPWFIGEIADGVDWGVATLPIVSETGKAARPFLTVEAVLFPTRAKAPEGARVFGAWLAGPEGAKIRAEVGRQAVAWAATYQDPVLAADPVLQTFRAQLSNTVPMSNRPEMQAVWEPAKGALKSVLRGDDATEALARAQGRLRAAVRPAPPAAEPMPFVLAVGVLGVLAAGWLVTRQLKAGPHPDGSLATRVSKSRAAYAYLAPAFIGLGLLALLPFAVGLLMAFTTYDGGADGGLLDKLTFVGLANFTDILFGESYGITDPLSFYFTGVVTVLWTVANVFLHVAFGLALALLLRAPWLKLKGFYRAVLIIPWAVPNYITALIWKGMFHKQFGAINAVLGFFGLEPVGWFSSFWTAFTANVVTNTWLGFPFMMVVALGALGSIPSDLYEAARVDGASRWQQFRHITLPLLKPAMLPAIILGMIWTFNMFNIVYLVSGGEPDGATDILISEAYRWAFQRREQYGYAAAYATLIFVILVVYTLATRKLTGGEEAA